MSERGNVAKLLLVDDVKENLVALEALVRGENREVHRTTSGEEALSLMVEHEFALAILDVQMPGMNGFELAETMRSATRTRNIPIIFVTAGRELNYAFRGYEAGAVDFLYKPLDPHTVRSKVGVFVDLFLQRLALQAAHAALERSVRMRDDFMSMVSHELRTPLGTLLLQTQIRKRMLKDGQLDSKKLQHMADRDERQARAMLRLIDDMVDVSRLRTGRLVVVKQRCDLVELAARVIDDFAEQATAAGYSVTVKAPPTLPLVCDEFRIEQVLTNLLTNAFRYGRQRPISVELAAENGMACLSVTDQGVGIAAEDQKRIFEQFERVAADSSQVPGLGLGLYIARQIVEAHGGRIGLISEPGQGSRFSVWLPAEPALQEHLRP